MHAVVDDMMFGMGGPPHALVKQCFVDKTWMAGRNDGGFGHIESQEIREADRHETVTCMACAAYCP